MFDWVVDICYLKCLTNEMIGQKNLNDFLRIIIRYLKKFFPNIKLKLILDNISRGVKCQNEYL